MPFVVTSNVIVCKDLESNGAASENFDRHAAAQRAAEAAPRLPEHLRQPGDGSRRATKKPDADGSASG